MTTLDRNDRQLLVLSALAAANHRMQAETASFLPILDALIHDHDDRACVSALLLHGLGRTSDAKAALASAQGEGCTALRELLAGAVPSKNVLLSGAHHHG